MNRQSKNFRRLLAKARSEITVKRLQTMPGGKLAEILITIPFGYQARHSKRPKVGGMK